jgi:hypothetical protein
MHHDVKMLLNGQSLSILIKNVGVLNLSTSINSY